MSGLVRLEIDGEVGVIRLDRPPVNAVNGVMHRELVEVAGRGGRRSADAGGGALRREKAFAGGRRHQGDGRPGTRAERRRWLGSLNDAVNADRPAAAAGHRRGHRLCARRRVGAGAGGRPADRRRERGARVARDPLGVIPGAGGTQRLPRLIGASRAKELIFTGRRVGGVEAVAIGLATRAVPAEAVFEEAMTLARRLAAGATAALTAAKRAIDDGLDGSLEIGLGMEAERFVELFATQDQKIGMASFLQSGPGKATFVGR